MRIGVNTRILIEGKLEGVGLFTHEVFKRVVEMMPEDEFIFFFDRAPSEQFIYNDRVKGVILSPQARHPFLWYWWFERSLPAALKKYEIDVFLSPDGHGSLRTEVPTIMTIHDLAFHHYKEHLPFIVHRYYNHYTPKFAAKANHILAVSEFTKADICQSYKVAEEKITVVGNGCDNAVRPVEEQQKQRVRKHYTGQSPYILYVGSIHPRKNTGRLLKAFDQFKEHYNSDIKLVIAGRWAWKTGGIRNILKKMKHKEDVFMFGHIERGELGKLMGAALALVYPSLFEGFGIPVLEAMYAEVPVITSANSSMSEVAGPAAYYIDPENEEELAVAMERISKDYSLRSELVEAGKVERKRYSWEITAQKVVDSIKAIKKGLPNGNP